MIGAMSSHPNGIMNVNKTMFDFEEMKGPFLLHGDIAKNPTMVEPRSLHFLFREVPGVNLSPWCLLFTKPAPTPNIFFFFF